MTTQLRLLHTTQCVAACYFRHRLTQVITPQTHTHTYATNNLRTTRNGEGLVSSLPAKTATTRDGSRRRTLFSKKLIGKMGMGGMGGMGAPPESQRQTDDLDEIPDLDMD